MTEGPELAVLRISHVFEILNLKHLQGRKFSLTITFLIRPHLSEGLAMRKGGQESPGLVLKIIF